MYVGTALSARVLPPGWHSPDRGECSNITVQTLRNTSINHKGLAMSLPSIVMRRAQCLPRRFSQLESVADDDQTVIPVRAVKADMRCGLISSS